MNIEHLKALDHDFDLLKKSMYEGDTLKVTQEDLTIIKSISSQYNDVIGLINYLVRNQSELCK